jgi:cytoskeletal protein CcmA (bactofilin family)
VVSDYVETSLLRGTGSLFLQPDKTDERLFQIYNTAAPSGSTDIHFKGNADFNYFGDDINYLKIDDSAQTVSIVGVNGLFVSGNVYQTGSLYVDGTITAKELYINYVTSSVLYSSGSTKFGDTLDDNHNFTGSLRTTGSVIIDGDLTVRGTTTLTSTDVLRESLIVSGAMAIMQAQIQAQIVSASLSMQGQVVISQQGNVDVMDLGSF